MYALPIYKIRRRYNGKIEIRAKGSVIINRTKTTTVQPIVMLSCSDVLEKNNYYNIRYPPNWSYRAVCIGIMQVIYINIYTLYSPRIVD